MLTYFLSNGTQASGDHSCPGQRCFAKFTSHQLDLNRPTVHANLALKSERNARVTPVHLLSSAFYIASTKPTHLFYFQPYSSAAATPMEWQPAPATRVTLLLPSKECERDKKCQKSNMSKGWK